MRRAISIYCFLPAISFAAIGAGASASEEPDKHFEGPYRIATTAPRRIRATVKSAYWYPKLSAREWLVAYSLPPEFPGQTRARGRIEVAEASLAKPGQIRDESALRQPLATLHWIPESARPRRGLPSWRPTT